MAQRYGPQTPSPLRPLRHPQTRHQQSLSRGTITPLMASSPEPRDDGFSRGSDSASSSSPWNKPGHIVSHQSVARGSTGGSYGPYAYQRVPPQSPITATAKIGPVTPKGLSHTTTGLPSYMLTANEPEPDDAFHNPDIADQPFDFCSGRGFANMGMLMIVLFGIITLFTAYPVIHFFTTRVSTVPGFNLGGINASGQIPDLPNLPKLIDKDTPQSALSRTDENGRRYNLVFSDEFNTDGRTFWPGDDPFWEGQDMHYWATGDLEWYDPQALATKEGKLVITMSKVDPQINRNLNYSSGFLSSWNKICFNTAYVEVAISLPGSGDVSGFWPGAWTMGNLGRAGFGATTDGMWPYSYDSCDAGTFPFQMDKAGNPVSSQTSGSNGNQLSNLPGQRLSACTCPDSDHPGPSVGVGRGVPEIDILEAQIDVKRLAGEVSQSLQLAPFDAGFAWNNNTPAATVFDPTISKFNSFKGSQLQESASVVTLIDNTHYNDQAYGIYGLEWWSDPNHRDDSYSTWWVDGKQTWTLTAAALGPNAESGVDQRLIAEEPMYLILNLGISQGFAFVDFENLEFPAKMFIDYVRVYQRDDVRDGVTCNPKSRPTTDYINRHPEAYTNANQTTWNGAGNPTPRNSKYDGC